ncbi:MAG: PD40 domain-containing protein [Chloroflexi bacterium]|nr:PD40 domain-containing protein [Chloroflexota bacterium]
MVSDSAALTPATRRFSRFDLAVWATIGAALLLTAVLAWWNGRNALPTFANSTTPRILYIGWAGANDANQLYVVHPDGSGRAALTSEPRGVLDYAISPDGTRIVYSASNANNGADLWIMDEFGRNRRQLLACPEAACTQAVWSPDGRRLVYEQRTIPAPGAPPGPPRLWWLDSETGATLAVFQDSQWLGLGARFSPDGRWLSYIAPINQEIQAYNLETGDSLIIPSKTGEPAAWSPDSASLLVSEMLIMDERFNVHLFSANLADADLTNLSGVEMDTNDGLPVFSPNGEWIAFGRKKPRAPMGKQLWLMRADGSGATAVTANSEVHYGQPAWSPDGAAIVMQGYYLAEPGAEPKLWLVDVASGELREVASPGIQPRWLP